MNIIKPSFMIEERDELRGGLAIIERAARTCYKTENAITEGSAEQIVKMLIRKGHESALEHGDYIFRIEDYHIADNLAYALGRLEEESAHHIHLTLTSIEGRHVVSGNIRAWRELMAADTTAKYYFSGSIDPVYTADILPQIEREEPDPRVIQIHYSDLESVAERRAHLRQTVRFTIDRGVSHEFVRHRVMSFSQESTRFCNYSQEKFNREITVIEPCYLMRHTEPYDLWKRQCMSAETAYFQLLNLGLVAQEARAVLPTSTKTELVMTGTLSQWQHFFDLRALEKAGRPHPQALEVAKPLCIEMANRFPGVIVID